MGNSSRKKDPGRLPTLKTSPAVEERETKILILGPRASGKSVLFRAAQVALGRWDAQADAANRADAAVAFAEMEAVNRAALVGTYGTPDDGLVPDVVHWVQQMNLARYLASVDSTASLPQLFYRRTTGIHECVGKRTRRPDKDLHALQGEDLFGPSKEVVRVLDVGGARSERRKWIHCMSEVSTLVGCVSLPALCLPLLEDEATLNWDESKNLLRELAASPWLRSSNFVVILGGLDLFEELVPLHAERLVWLPMSVSFLSLSHFFGEGEGRRANASKGRACDCMGVGRARCRVAGDAGSQ
jgi:hypothetical protein